MNQEKSHVSSARVVSGLTPYTGKFGKQELIHILRRTMFGVKKSTINNFSNLNLDAVLSQLLTDTDDPNDQPLVHYTDPNITMGKTWVTAPESGVYNNQRRVSFKAWWTKNMIFQKDSITEKMVIFWHNHFPTEVSDDSSIFGYWNNALIRKNHLGNFKTFVKEMTVDPLMLKYLNGFLNVKSAPDENYARELQELFTVGKGPNSLYTEDDVKAAAKVLTGFQVRNTSDITVPPITKPYSVFTSARHDTTNKQFSAFYGNKVIAGKTGTNGELELDELINMIFSNSETANHICRKLYRFFVYYDIDQATEDNVILPLADIFRMNNYEIKPVLKALLQSEHFFDLANRGAYIKTPLDTVIGLVREFNLEFNPTVLSTQYGQYYTVSTYAGTLLQFIGDPPNVAGWQAFYQSPLFHEIWINTFTYPIRRDLGFGTVTNKFGNSIKTDILSYIKNNTTNPSNPNILITDLLELHISLPLDTNVTAFLKTNTLLTGQTSDSYWTTAWNNYIANPNTANTNVVLLRINALFTTILNLNEYQLC